MILTITYEKHNAIDLGYILHKNPYRPQSIKMNYGKAYIFYPEISDVKCTMAMMLDINSISLVRKMENSIFAYVNDRPYTSSSFFSVAIGKIFGTAISGICKKRPELVDEKAKLSANITMIPCKGNKQTIYNFFEPLGYKVEIEDFILDDKHLEWGNSKYYNITITKITTVKELLRHIYVIIPSFDAEKHYFVSEDEIKKLERNGEGWLKEHPFRDDIISRYLIRKRSLINEAVKCLLDKEDELKTTKNIRLDKKRIDAVCEVILEKGVSSVIDIGCGEGKLLKQLIRKPEIKKLTGVDVSFFQLEKAKQRLHYDEMFNSLRDKLNLIQGSLTYIDERFKGYEMVTVIEVIEHMNLERLWTFEKNIFINASPKHIIITTPNKEYNEKYGMKEENLRHNDHRFEWTRAEFKTWCKRVAKEYGFSVIYKDIGESDELYGSPTQMGVFTKCK